MELWFVLLISLCIAALLKSAFDLFKQSQKHGHKLPPGPLSLPFLGNLQWLRTTFPSMEPIIRSVHAKYGPVVSLRIGSSPRAFIFVSSHSLAHQALVHHGAAFADRPRPPATARILDSDQHSINSAAYGPTWRLLRRNLTSKVVHSSRGLPSFAPLRRRVLGILLDRIESQSRSSDEVVVVLDHFKHAMFCLLVFMCFGEDDAIDDEKIGEIMTTQVQMIVSLRRFRVLNFWPSLGKLVLRNRWREFMKMANARVNALVPLIRRRTRAKQGNLCYVDTLMELELPEEGKRKLTEGEMVSLCSEFLTAGTDTTATALQWIMANLVKYPDIQQKLFAEIKQVLNPRKEGSEAAGEVMMVEEDDLQKMPYLKAVILEGLRRHPPGHFVLPHAVTEEVELGGYVIPKNASVNFMVAEMGWDPKVWEDPMAFKPERFISNGGDSGGEKGEEGGFDITGSREIKMMPFGVGRRICPGLGVAMLHLEYFVANLVWRFEWKAVDGEDVDLSEKEEFTVVMKNPLRAKLSPRLPKTHIEVA